ncbi:hypothetical protein Salat_2682800 [Sesamum alatum]|uniref:RNase H type-1 domain-containing protein n=1 Tax=Sesamum alatum TaxID=300844 RepID=A0AAE1XQF1_9LAMI|nr:hypothetical protein Salat_2682800 [Sesamum alatum]
MRQVEDIGKNDSNVLITKVLAPRWTMHVDGSTMSGEGGVGFWIMGLEGESYDFAIKLNFKVINNEATYEALLSGIEMLRSLKAGEVAAFMDSKLGVGHFLGA